MKKNSAKAAFKASLPVFAGYIALGIGFGVLLESKGYSFLWAGFMALTMYSGALQYAAVDIIASGAGLINTALIALFINARHFFYGLSILDTYKNMGPRKAYMIFGLTDETYSLVCTGKAPEGTEPKKYFFLLTLFNQLYWITGCVLGNVIGSLVPFDLKGVDFAMTALFIVIFVEQWMSQKNHIPALIGVSASVICLLIFGADNFLIPTMVLIAALLAVFRKKINSREGGENDG